jgi:subtilisin-like proprotein convertase family protein
MPAISPNQLRTMAQTLAAQGNIDRAGVNQLIGAALGDQELTPALKSELNQILADFGDQFTAGDAAKTKLETFLSIGDTKLQALSHRLEVDDGVISFADAQLLTGLAKRDGQVSLDERFSLSALLAGTRIADDARAHLAGVANLSTVSLQSAPDLQIPDNDPAGATDKVTSNLDGKVADLSIDLDLVHTYRGDLIVELESPDGKTIKLHNREGRGDDDLKGTFPTTLRPSEPLDGLVGADAKGEWKLHVKDLAGRDVGAVKSWGLNLAVEKAAGPGQTVDLAPSGKFRPTFMTPDGVFVSDPSIAQPNAQQRATGMFHMASVLDDKKTNALRDANLPLAAREKVFAGLEQALKDVPASGAHLDSLTDLQALQMRASTVTVLLGLLEATGDSGEEAVLKNKIFMAYRGALNAETDPTLRDSMIWNLHNIRGSLPASMQDKIADLVDQIAPTSPPYDDWFANGNDTLNVSWTTGADEEFFSGTVELLGKKGFTKEDPSATSPPLVMVKTDKDDNGDDVHVRVHIQVNRDSIFNKMDDPKFQIVGYDGHSNIGRNIPASLNRAPQSNGKKLIFYGLCAGKDNLHNVREQFPDAQLLTTFNSSYFNTRTDNGKKVMTRSENFNVLMELIDGAVHRKDWKKINNEIKRDAVLYPWHHPMAGGTNYISPIHTDIRRTVLDSDNDGQADYLDKLVTFDSQRVATDTRREFDPVDPGRPADKLDGTIVHMATQALNTATGYNSKTKAYKKGNIIGDGYFTPNASEQGTIVKFERTQKDGETVLLMKVNKNYAHMSVESLRAVAQYSFIKEIAGDEGLNATDSKMMALTFAAFSIMYDNARWGRDDAVWKGLLEQFNLPPGIPFDPIRRLLDDEHHDYSGNMTHVREWKKAIDPSVLAELAKPEVG